MFVNRFLKYLTTEKGRAFTRNSVMFTGIGMFSLNYIPNTILIDKFKSVVQAYKQGEERPVSDKLQQRFEYAMAICKCSEFEKSYLQPFIAYGFDTMHLGSTKSKFGALIGVPVNYSYDKINDIERGDMKIRDQTIDWSTEDGKNLQDSLVLTEIEQVFGIARSILQAKTYKLMMDSFYPPVCLLTMYGTANFINQRMNLYAKPLLVRMCLYSLLSVFGYGLYSFMKDFTQVYYDTSIDKELAALGPEMVAAGIQFYDKMLKKNVSLRNLTGENIYSALGNENYFLRQKSLPLTIRKSFFLMKRLEFDEASTKKVAS